MADLLDNDFKTMVFKMLKELKEDVEKIKNMLYEQNGNINKKGKTLKNPPPPNAGGEKCKN